MKLRVPGKIMLCGEYAVLQGATSLAATVDSWLTLTLDPADRRLVSSDLWPQTIDLDQADAAQLDNEALLQSTLLSAPANQGFHLTVQSDLNIEYGLGSSSALRLAVHLAFSRWEKGRELTTAERWQAARFAWQEQLKQQSFASGYDTVVQLHGGLVRWTPSAEWPGQLEGFDAECLNPWIHPFVGGKGAPTKAVGGSMRQWLTRSNLWDDLRTRSEALRSEMEALLIHKEGNIRSLIEANRAHRALFQDGPGFPSALHKLLASQTGFDRSWTFKTTGAGGEDAILLIGDERELISVKQTLSYHGWRPLGLGWQNRGASIV